MGSESVPEPIWVQCVDSGSIPRAVRVLEPLYRYIYNFSTGRENVPIAVQFEGVQM